MTRQTGEKITYRGFKPTLMEMQAAQRALTSVEQMAPSDASVRVELDSSQGLFHGKMMVVSSVGLFNSHGTKDTLDVLLEDLSSDVFTQLSEWKRDRFSVDAG